MGYEVSAGSRSGLRIKVHPTGTKTWIFRYRLNEKQARMTLLARTYEVWMKYIRIFHTTCSFQLPKSIPDGFVHWSAHNVEVN